jgi:class 3 adenylate cyclase
MRTLLPIFRNILFVVVIAVAVLMALAAMGFEIGPLVAGLSVVGAAIGFGCQNFRRELAVWRVLPLEIVVALHVGTVVYGNIGAAERLDFTVIGPAVNLVSRLEAMAKTLNTKMC